MRGNRDLEEGGKTATGKTEGLYFLSTNLSVFTVHTLAKCGHANSTYTYEEKRVTL